MLTLFSNHLSLNPSTFSLFMEHFSLFFHGVVSFLETNKIKQNKNHLFSVKYIHIFLWFFCLVLYPVVEISYYIFDKTIYVFPFIAGIGAIVYVFSIIWNIYYNNTSNLYLILSNIFIAIANKNYIFLFSVLLHFIRWLIINMIILHFLMVLLGITNESFSSYFLVRFCLSPYILLITSIMLYLYNNVLNFVYLYFYSKKNDISIYKTMKINDILENTFKSLSLYTLVGMFIGISIGYGIRSYYINVSANYLTSAIHNNMSSESTLNTTNIETLPKADALIINKAKDVKFSIVWLLNKTSFGKAILGSRTTIDTNLLSKKVNMTKDSLWEGLEPIKVIRLPSIQKVISAYLSCENIEKNNLAKDRFILRNIIYREIFDIVKKNNFDLVRTNVKVSSLNNNSESFVDVINVSNIVQTLNYPNFYEKITGTVLKSKVLNFTLESHTSILKEFIAIDLPKSNKTIINSYDHKTNHLSCDKELFHFDSWQKDQELLALIGLRSDSLTKKYLDDMIFNFNKDYAIYTLGLSPYTISYHAGVMYDGSYKEGCQNKEDVLSTTFFKEVLDFEKKHGLTLDYRRYLLFDPVLGNLCIKSHHGFIRYNYDLHRHDIPVMLFDCHDNRGDYPMHTAFMLQEPNTKDKPNLKFWTGSSNDSEEENKKLELKDLRAMSLKEYEEYHFSKKMYEIKSDGTEVEIPWKINGAYFNEDWLDHRYTGIFSIDMENYLESNYSLLKSLLYKASNYNNISKTFINEMGQWIANHRMWNIKDWRVIVFIHFINEGVNPDLDPSICDKLDFDGLYLGKREEVFPHTEYGKILRRPNFLGGVFHTCDYGQKDSVFKDYQDLFMQVPENFNGIEDRVVYKILPWKNNLKPESPLKPLATPSVVSKKTSMGPPPRPTHTSMNLDRSNNINNMSIIDDIRNYAQDDEIPQMFLGSSSRNLPKAGESSGTRKTFTGHKK